MHLQKLQNSYTHTHLWSFVACFWCRHDIDYFSTPSFPKFNSKFGIVPSTSFWSRPLSPNSWPRPPLFASSFRALSGANWSAPSPQMWDSKPAYIRHITFPTCTGRHMRCTESWGPSGQPSIEASFERHNVDTSSPSPWWSLAPSLFSAFSRTHFRETSRSTSSRWMPTRMKCAISLAPSFEVESCYSIAYHHHSHHHHHHAMT